jgi:hypothetical protein
MSSYTCFRGWDAHLCSCRKKCWRLRTYSHQRPATPTRPPAGMPASCSLHTCTRTLHSDPAHKVRLLPLAPRENWMKKRCTINLHLSESDRCEWWYMFFRRYFLLPEGCNPTATSWQLPRTQIGGPCRTTHNTFLLFSQLLCCAASEQAKPAVMQ